jgi:plasmid replication initiation protein
MEIQTSLFSDDELLEEERNQLVVKHNSLIQKTRYSLNTQQQKIILYLISKIKPDDDELKEYDYDLKDFCRVCGIELNGKNYANIKESILQLHAKAFWIDTEEVDTMVSWIQKAYIYKKDTRLKIRLDDDLKPFLLHLREQFTTYELSYILVMRSKYSIRLYEYLKSFLSLGIITISVKELKELLECENEYGRWCDFKRRVLDKALAEINEYTDLQISTELIRQSRNIEKIIFRIERKQEPAATITRIENTARLKGTYHEIEKSRKVNADG